MKTKIKKFIAISSVITVFATGGITNVAYAGDRAIGGVIGGVSGGVIGAQIGKGKGRTAAIITGALLGTMVGSALTSNSAHGSTHYVSEKKYHYYDRKYPAHKKYHGHKSYGHKNYGYGHSYPAYTYSQPTTYHYVNTTEIVNNNKAYDDSYCREFNQVVNIGGKPHESYGTACRQIDGSWKIIEQN